MIFRGKQKRVSFLLQTPFLSSVTSLSLSLPTKTTTTMMTMEASNSNTSSSSSSKKYRLTRCCLAFLAVIQCIVFFDAYRNNPYNNIRSTSTTTANKLSSSSSSDAFSRSTEEELLLHVHNNDHHLDSNSKSDDSEDGEDDNRDEEDGSEDGNNSEDDNRDEDDGEDEVNDSNDNDNGNDRGSEDNDEGNSNDNDNSDSNDQEEDEDEDATSATDDKGRKRTVYWMDYKSIVKDQADYYSGSWYMPIKKFKKSLNAKSMNTLEDASGTAVYHENEKTVRMPYDWFDFSVEHMSKWYKSLDVTSSNENDVAINKINNNLLRYIQDTPQKMIKTNTNTTITMMRRRRTRNRRMKERTNNTAVVTPQQSQSSKQQQLLPLLHPTIAIIPFSPDIRYDTPLAIERSKNLTTLMLGATISSLIRLGFGRIVIVGIEKDDYILVNDTFNLIKSQFIEDKHIQLAYVQVTDKKTYKTQSMKVNRPKAAVRGLQLALTGKLNNTDTSMWLGTQYNHDYWKYVYFTEPDLVLQTRINGVTSTIPSLYEELNRGHSIMPFRLQPIQHESDLIGTTRNDYIKSAGIFKTVLELNGNTDNDDDDGSDGGDMCCDGGTDRPIWDKKDDPIVECYSFWYQCGFLHDMSHLDDEIKHRRIVEYTPLMRITTGTNIVTIPGSEHSRKCHPVKRRKKNGIDDDSIDFCQPPSSPTKRSYAVSEKKK
jgi:hypothetical protein